MTWPPHPLDHRPCGACGTLVPGDTGCTHWRPEKAAERAVKMRKVRERRTAEIKMKGARR